jgi:hypothetical protein
MSRGDDTIKLFRLMEKLRWQAEAAGGMVLSCFGNHEVMNAIGDWRYAWLWYLGLITNDARVDMFLSQRSKRSVVFKHDKRPFLLVGWGLPGVKTTRLPIAYPFTPSWVHQTKTFIWTRLKAMTCYPMRLYRSCMEDLHRRFPI